MENIKLNYGDTRAYFEQHDKSSCLRIIIKVYLVCYDSMEKSRRFYLYNYWNMTFNMRLDELFYQLI